MFLALLLVACAGPAPASDPGITDDTILIGNYSPLSGPAASYASVSKGADALFKSVNEAGGINGRKIKFIVEDDAYQASRTVAAVKKLVELDKVFALVGGLGTATGQAVLDYLNDNKVPHVAPATGAGLFANPPKRYIFTLQTNYQIEGGLLAQYALRDLKATRVGIFYQNDAFGKEGFDGIAAELRRAGIEPAVVIPYESAETDFSAHALKLQQAQPEAVILWSIPKPTSQLVREADKLGFRPRWVSSVVNSDPVLFQLAGPAWDGAIVACWLPPFDDPGPKMARYRDVMKKYYPQEPIGGFTVTGYAIAEVFVEGAKRAGRNLTREGLVAAMETMKNWNDGLTFNVSYGPNQRQGQQAVAFTRAERQGDSGRYVLLSEFREFR